MSDKEYHDSIKLYYEERLRSQIKKKFSHCKDCSNKKQFIDEPGKLIYTCGSEKGKCGAQMIINLTQYMYYPDMKKTSESILQSYIDLSNHTDIYSAEEIKQQEEFIQINKEILKKCESSFSTLNKTKERKTLIEKTHKDRINLKKEQNLLMDNILKEEDKSKKYSMMNEYLGLNKEITEQYYNLHDFCHSTNNFIIVEEGSVTKGVETYKEPNKEPKKPKKMLGVRIDKNLIPELQDLIKQPMNDMNMNLIVAYRDTADGSRKEQLKQFKEQMNLIFKDQTNTRIYIIEQEGSRDDYSLLPELIQQPNTEMAKFNLGILKNIGFSLASKDMKGKKQAYYILSDVDLLPSINLVKDYLTYPDNPIHLGNKGTRYNKDGRDQSFLGGVISVSEKDFKNINGYPNNFWGWGGEDNALNRRFHDNRIKIDKSEDPVIDLERLTLKEKLTKLKEDKVKEMRKREKLDEDKSTWKDNGLSNVDDLYTIKKKFKKGNIIHYKVHLTIEPSASVESVES